MSAETLRRAAALMRERAEAATPGPWHKVERSHGGPVVSSDEGPVLMGYSRGRRDVIHAASWHPAVALAIADWVDSHAGDLASAGGHLPSCDSPGDVLAALDVARAYLGEQP